MSTHAWTIAEYRRGVQVLRDAVAGLTLEQARARPVPGKWSTLEVVSHLADFEPIYVDRMKRIIAMEKPLLMGADENSFVKSLFPNDRDLAEELQMVEITRLSFAKILDRLTPAQFQRVGVHSERGLTTLDEILKLEIGHLEHHVSFIAAKRKALGC
jgi:uncharacterized damage-inducible protein DinB